MRIDCLGGCREVGKSAFLVEIAKKSFLLDYGLDVQTMHVPLAPKKIDTMILTHPHLDHSGQIPYLYKTGYKGNVWSTALCFEMVELLLRDSLRVQEKKSVRSQYLFQHVQQMERARRVLGYKQKIKLGEANFQLRDAGHIPGSAMVLLEGEGKKVLYTGDYKTVDTKLSGPADTDLDDIDVLISECTYSYKDHPARETLVKKLRKYVKGVIDNGGWAVFPCFALGRTQDLLLNLCDLGIPVYLAGMGIKTTKIFLHYQNLKNHEKLKTGFNFARKILKPGQKKLPLEHPSIIIATAGMMQAGYAVYYAKKLLNDVRNSLIFVGYQAEGTPGRTLLDTGRFTAEGMDVKPKMDVKFFDMSVHIDRSGLFKFFKKANPKKIILVHGENCEGFAKEVREKGFDVIAPKNGDSLKI